MQRKILLVSLSAAAAALVLLLFFTPQGAVRVCLAWHGQVSDAFTVSVAKSNMVDFGGQQYTVRYHTDDPADRMRPYFFYVKRLTFLGPYVVTQAGTGP